MTTANDFDEMARAVPFPSAPKMQYIKREDFNSNKEYHAAVAEAEDKHEAAKADLKTLRDTYNRKQKNITDEFWQWAEEDTGLYRLPENVRSAVREYTHQEGHSGGFSEIFIKLLDIIDVVMAAYDAGKSQSK